MTQAKERVITVERREPEGKGAAGRLRREGKVPAVVYGHDKPPVPIAIGEKDVKELLNSAGGENTIFLLKLTGTSEERRAMIRELQVDPLTGKYIHIDFIRVVRGHKLTVDIPVVLEGDSVGVRHGGRLDFVTRELHVEILPRHMFDRFTVDISDLEVGDHVTIADLAPQLPESGRFLDEEGRVIVLVEPPRKELQDEEEVGAEGAVDELMAGETAEPERIGRGGEGESAE